MRRSRLLVIAAGVLVAGVVVAGAGLTACATPDPNPPGPPGGSAGPGAAGIPTIIIGSGLYRASGIVLESRDHGPMLCLTVDTSYPPQCGTVELVGWDWDAVDDEESTMGVTWGGPYTVTGTWDGQRLILAGPPARPDPAGSEPNAGPDFSTPCPAPPGGWTVVDPATTSQTTLYILTQAAAARPDYAGLWLDQPIRGTFADNDPTNLVVNVRVTGDVAQAERELRQIWGGALCVLPAARSFLELSAIQAAIGDQADTIRMTHNTIDNTTGLIEVGVVIDDGTLQAYFDERYGAGVVRVVSWLQPV
jgi:hypothetical protein